MSLITNSKELNKLCNKLKNEKFICVDTEFIREKFYFPKLCLIQIGDSKGNGWAIDPLSKNINLNPIFKLFSENNIIKVFHSPRQDFEIIYNLTKTIPYPIFDTQSAAMACGYGDSVSYEYLVNDIIGAKIDKTLRFTDWQKRPLTNKQIKYAISDVTYLSKIYEILCKNIKTQSREEWIREEINNFYNKNIYFTKPYEAWKKIKFKSNNIKIISIIREIAAEREKIAQKLNIPRNKIFRDELITKIAKNPPKNLKDFNDLRGLNLNNVDESTKLLIIKSIKRGMSKNNKNLKITKNKTKASKTLIEILKIILINAAEKNNISSLLIANRNDINDIALGKKNVKALKGWRYDVFGSTATKFMTGKISIKINKGNIIIQ